MLKRQGVVRRSKETEQGPKSQGRFLESKEELRVLDTTKSNLDR